MYLHNLCNTNSFYSLCPKNLYRLQTPDRFCFLIYLEKSLNYSNNPCKWLHRPSSIETNNNCSTRKSPQTRYQMVVFEPFVVLLFAIISVRGTWHASGRGVCEKTIFPLLPVWQERQNRALAKGGAGFDGPKRPHFARHTRRCSTRLFAEALKRCTRVQSEKNKHVRSTSAR